MQAPDVRHNLSMLLDCVGRAVSHGSREPELGPGLKVLASGAVRYGIGLADLLGVQPGELDARLVNGDFIPNEGGPA